MDIKITKTTQPKTMPPEDQLGFGKVFTDHMLLVDWNREEGWHDARIEPFGRISLHPASTVLHYGAEIFEGLKAYRRADGGVQLFRPMENINFCTSKKNGAKKAPSFFRRFLRYYFASLSALSAATSSATLFSASSSNSSSWIKISFCSSYAESIGFTSLPFLRSK